MIGTLIALPRPAYRWWVSSSNATYYPARLRSSVPGGPMQCRAAAPGEQQINAVRSGICHVPASHLQRRRCFHVGRPGYVTGPSRSFPKNFTSAIPPHMPFHLSNSLFVATSEGSYFKNIAWCPNHFCSLEFCWNLL